MLVNILRTVRSRCGFQHLPRYIHLSARLDALKTFTLCDIGEGISEVELVEWKKKVGDEVEEMEEVCTVRSDKAAVEISSRYTGIVRQLHVKEGDVIKIGSSLMDIETDEIGQGTDKPVEVKVEQVGSIEESPKISTSKPSEAFATPAVRNLAKQLGIDLNQLTPSDPSGRITAKDVENFAKEGSKSTKVVLKGIGLAMVKSMVASLAVPHVTVGEDFDLTELKKLHEELKAKCATKLTLTPFLIKTISIALEDFPILNSKFTGDSYVLFKDHNISIAIDTPHGLLVPNIKSVQSKSIRQIQEDMNRLQRAAFDNKLAPADLKDGTCSFSNLGALGGTFVSARLFDGQALILALGACRKQPVYVNDELKPRWISPGGLTADHRHIDGATIARFANRLKALLAEPNEIRGAY